MYYFDLEYLIEAHEFRCVWMKGRRVQSMIPMKETNFWSPATSSLFLVAAMLTSTGQAQIQGGGYPLNWKDTVQSDHPWKEFSPLDVAILEQEDAVTATMKDAPWRLESSTRCPGRCPIQESGVNKMVIGCGGLGFGRNKPRASASTSFDSWCLKGVNCSCTMEIASISWARSTTTT